MEYPTIEQKPATHGERSQIAAILRKAQLDIDKMPEAEALRFFRLDTSGQALYRLARTRRQALWKKSNMKVSDPSPEKTREALQATKERKKGPFAISGGTW